VAKIKINLTEKTVCACPRHEVTDRYNKWGDERKYLPGHQLHGKNNTPAVRLKISESKLGSKNPQYKNRADQELTPNQLDKRIRGQIEYSNWISGVRNLHGFICVECSREGISTEVHHKIPLLTIILKHGLKTVREAMRCKPIWNVKNGKVLCRSCHMNDDGRMINLDRTGTTHSLKTRIKQSKLAKGRNKGKPTGAKAWITRRARLAVR
jgi:hypothetical protein